jgi:predicted dehydrogenase/threonine dehydrogenase-like Zn-dependent dehydrogenase
MKQLLQNMRSGETYIAEVPRPAARPGTALVETAVSLVSAGTERMLVEFAEKSLVGKARSRPDLARQVVDKARREGVLTTLDSALNRLDQPMVLGYSSAGMIRAIGPGLQGFQVGERVACAGGGYAVHAEYAAVPQNLLAHLPSNVEFEQAAFVTLGAIALHGFRLATPQIGERVAVIGLGLLGLLAAGIARAAGCQVLGIDIDPQRVALGEQMGLTQGVLRAKAEAAAQAFSQGRGLDAILICADTHSDDPVELAGTLARDRARVVALGAVGLNLPRKIYYEKEISFINSRSYGPGRYDPRYEEGGQDYPIGYVRWTEGRNLEAVVGLLASGALDVRPLITHRFPLENAPQAYELITGKTQEHFLGVLLTYPQDSELSHAQAVVTSQLTPSEPGGFTPVNEVGLGVFGAGNFARAVMLPAASKIQGLKLTSITSGSGVNAQHAAQKYNMKAAHSVEEVLADPQVNTVAVLTRHNLHASQVLAALAAGKHVFCEKPLATNSTDLDEIAATLEDDAPHPLLTVGFNRRFAPLAQGLAAFLKDRLEPFAAHYRVNAGLLPQNHWLHDPEQGGGRLIGEGCHFVDFLTFLAGTPPISVSAVGLPDDDRYRQDNVQLTYTFPDGSLGTITYLANGDKAFAKERLEVFCGGKVAVLDDFRTLETVQNGHRETAQSRLRQDKGHRAIWEAFTNAILAGGPPPIPYSHLFGVTRATFAAVDALRTGQPQMIPAPV